MLFVWLALAVVLLAAELHHLALYLLFAGVGALAGAAVATVAPHAIGVQALVAVATAWAGMVLVRPKLSAVVHRRDGRAPARGVHGGFVGHHAVTTDVLTALGSLGLDRTGDAVGDRTSAQDLRRGHVRFAGEQWLAVTDWPDPVPAGTEVIITAVEGTTLHVLPLEPVSHALDPEDRPTLDRPRQEDQP